MAYDPIGSLLTSIKQIETSGLSAKPQPDSLTTGGEQLTYGPENNNIGGEAIFTGGVWDVFLCDKYSIDIILLMLSRNAQTYLRGRKANATPPVSRKQKDQLLREAYPTHMAKDL
tara:strand:+ start:945 stop:1289 length:345 start_codon:yes stop_codon:yes gene_type:complete